MRKVVLSAAVGLVLLPVPAAQATVTVLGPEPLRHLYSEAIEWWGQEPSACPSVALEYRTTLESVNVGMAVAPNEEKPYCSILILAGLESCEGTETMRHEVGHLLGYPHSPDPRSVMYGGKDGGLAPSCTRIELHEELHRQAFWRSGCGHHHWVACPAELPYLHRVIEHLRARLVASGPHEGRPY